MPETNPAVEEARRYIADWFPALGYIRIGARAVPLDHLTDQDAMLVADELRRLRVTATQRGSRMRTRRQ